MKKLYLLLVAGLWSIAVWAQELEARVIVNADQMPVELNKRIFQQLQIALSTFLNTQRWTSDTYNYYEKIECNFILNLERYSGDNMYQATLTVQSTRPVYNSLYLVSLLNIIDREVIFRYRENQNIIFNDARVQGSEDPLISNLSAIFAFYSYIILGLNYSSFGLKDGYPYFQKAFNVVNNAPENSSISGWTPYQSRRNRYWIADIFMNPIYNKIYDVYYKLYREVMDHLYKKDKDIYKNIIEVLEIVHEVATQNQTNLSIYPIFIQGKKEVLVHIFKEASNADKKYFLSLIEKIDPSNFLQYERGIQ